MNNSLMLVLIFFFAANISLMAFNGNEIENELMLNMQKSGFENISIRATDEKLLLTYENRIFRNEIHGFGKVLNILYNVLQDERSEIIATIVIIPQNREIPLVSLTVGREELNSYFRHELSPELFVKNIIVSFDIDDVWVQLEGRVKENKSALKTDIVFTPKLAAELDEFGDPIKLQLGIAPSLNTSLGAGSKITAEYIIPLIHRNFDVGDPVDPFRPGLININQVIRFPGNIFCSTGLGIFSDNRYGIDFELRKYFFNGILTLGGNVGLTGSLRVFDKEWEMTRMKTLTWFIDSGLRIPEYNLTVSVNYGQYLYEDKGLRCDISREFGEVEIGFFAQYTRSELLGEFTSGGFNFSVPLFPDEYSEPGIIRIKPAENFEWEYNAKHFIYFFQKRYSTGSSIESFIKKLQPDYVYKEIEKLTFDN